MERTDSDPRSDAELVEAANRGDMDAFGVLYQRYRDWVMRLAWRFTRDRDISLEVLQETFSYLLRKLPELHLRARMTTFLYPVVRNLSIRLQKKAGREVSAKNLLKDYPAPETVDPPRERLAEVLNVLPPEQREVVIMRFVDDMKLKEIAAALEIPAGTVKSRLYNALDVLKDDDRTRNYFQQT